MQSLQLECTFFTDTTVHPDKIMTGEYGVNKLTSKGEPLLVRIEDALLDISLGIYRSLPAEINSFLSYNRVQKIQGKNLFEITKMYPDIRPELSSIPIYWPLFDILKKLSRLEYPVVLLYSYHNYLRNHPVINHLNFNLVHMQDIHTISTDTNLLSPYMFDNPDCLFPRSFNVGNMDNLYTFKLSQ